MNHKCQPMIPPAYIVLFRGDDSDFVGNQSIYITLDTELSLEGCKAHFRFLDFTQDFDEIPEDKKLLLVFPKDKTAKFPLGAMDASLTLEDSLGRIRTASNRIHIVVTNSVNEAYCSEDPQAITVIMSGDKFLKDAEVSSDGKTLTITKNDGTEVSFSGGGGGGTNDYNDLENKPSINGTTLTGNINLATPEQLSLKADKTALDNHEGNTNNPHKVTAVQVGAIPISGGTLTGDLAVGEEHTASRKLTVAADNGANGITLQGGTSYGSGSSLTIGGSSVNGGTLTVQGGADIGGIIEVTGSGASIRKDGKEVATEEQVNAKADKATTLAGYGITDAATMASLAPEYSPSSAYAVGSFVYHDGNIYQCKTAIADGGEAWNAAHWELRKLDDFFTESNSLLNGRLSYERNETGLKDRAFNALTFDGTEYNLSTALEAVTPTASGQPRDLLIVATATAATTISFTAGTIKGDKPTIDGSGTWLITLTEYASGVWYCRQIKMEDAA